MTPLLTSLFSLLVVSYWFIMLMRNRMLPALFIFDLLMTAVLLADIIYYRYYQDLLSVTVLLQVGQAGTVVGSVGSLIKLTDIVLLADFFTLFPFVFYNEKQKSVSLRPVSEKIILLTVMLMLSGSMFWYYSWMAEYRDRFDLINNLGVLSYHLFDTGNFIRENVFGDEPMSKADELKVVNRFAASQKRPPGALTGIARGKNLIILQVEALQNFVINLSVNGQEITPNLNRLAGDSIYFKNFYTQTAQGNTSDAEFLTNTSLYPLGDRAVYLTYYKNKYQSLAGTLRETGYSTQVMHAFRESYWNRKFMYPALSFDKFISEKDYLQDEQIDWGLSDKSFLSQSAQMIKKTKQPFYTFLITLTSHFPYAFPPERKVLKLGEYEGTLAGEYLHAINYTDMAIGNFIEELKKLGVMDNSILVIYGDHFAMPENELSKVRDFVRLQADPAVERLKSPLLIRIPGRKTAETLNIPGGQVDIFPTLANIMGIDNKRLFPMGRDLLNTKEGFVAFRDGSFIDGNNVYHNIKANADNDPGYRLAKSELRISDLIVKGNLISKLLAR